MSFRPDSMITEETLAERTPIKTNEVIEMPVSEFKAKEEAKAETIVEVPPVEVQP